MNILAFDIATKTGWAVLIDGVLDQYGLLQLRNEGESIMCVDNFGEYPVNYQKYTSQIAKMIYEKIVDVVKNKKKWSVVIEETTKSKAVYTQKMLEWIHCQLIQLLADKGYKIVYLRTGEWRKAINLKMNKKDKENNKLVRSKAKRGLITKKHLSVRFVNEMFNLGFKMKDNDIADAICLSVAAEQLLSGKKSEDIS